MIDENEQRARQRFMLLNLVRITGLAMVFVGIAIAQGMVDLPPPVGWILALVGVADFFFAPRFLARGWKSDNR